MAAWPRMVEMGGDVSSIQDLLQRQNQKCSTVVRSSASQVTLNLNPLPSTNCSAGFRNVAPGDISGLHLRPGFLGGLLDLCASISPLYFSVIPQMRVIVLDSLRIEPIHKALRKAPDSYKHSASDGCHC